jgi:hypothetical protein
MDPPQFLLDALSDSITSGTFVDAKFYVFSRREASGSVGSPRALYCNSRVLNTVPYFSSCGYRGPPLHCAPDSIVSKCSRMHSRKDNQGTLTRNSLPSPPRTPRFTTICPTATLKMNARAPRKSIQRLPRAITPNRRRALKRRIQIRKCLRPHPPNIRHNRR